MQAYEITYQDRDDLVLWVNFNNNLAYWFSKSDKTPRNFNPWPIVSDNNPFLKTIVSIVCFDTEALKTVPEIDLDVIWRRVERAFDVLGREMPPGPGKKVIQNALTEWPKDGDPSSRMWTIDERAQLNVKNVKGDTFVEIRMKVNK